MYKKDIKWAVVGAGNGGQAVSGYLGYLGYEVNLYDPFEKTVNDIKKQGGIYLEGIENGFGKLAKISTNIEKVIKDTDMIMVINPSIYHRSIAKKCAPYLKDNQIIFLHPGATFGAFAFKKALKDYNCNVDITIAESNTLIYAARLVENGRVNILGKKDRLMVASLPANRNKNVIEILKQAYPEVEGEDNVIVTSIDNTNPIVHPAPTLLSTSLVESNRDWLYYWDGITESIGKFIEGMDNERINIGKKLGLELGKNLFTSIQQYQIEYNSKASTLSEAVRNTQAYSDIHGPHSLNVRYLIEDIPMGLVPLLSIGKLLKLPVKRIELIVNLAELMTGKDLTTNGRTLENLGLNGMTDKEIIDYANKGQKYR